MTASPLFVSRIMAKYLPTVDLWNPVTRADLDSGALKLQPGQWFVCGDKAATRSRFYRHNPATGQVVAFHGEPNKRGVATRKMREYVASGRRGK